MFDELIEGIDYTIRPFGIKEYEACTFSQCNFAGLDWTKAIFIDCIFQYCDISNVNLDRTALRNVHFNHCKMLGLRFDYCTSALFKATFLDCQLDHSIFSGMRLEDQNFTDCRLISVDFTETNLDRSVFQNCNLEEATFEFTNLREADFISSYNYKIDPEKNSIDRARFSKNGLAGLLDKYNIYIE